MSIPVRFNFYDTNGKFLTMRSIFTVSIGSNTSSLNSIQERLKESNIIDHRKFIDENVRYAVPLNTPDYMFDLYDVDAILPNKFKDR